MGVINAYKHILLVKAIMLIESWGNALKLDTILFFKNSYYNQFLPVDFWYSYKYFCIGTFKNMNTYVNTIQINWSIYIRKWAVQEFIPWRDCEVGGVWSLLQKCYVSDNVVVMSGQKEKQKNKKLNFDIFYYL